MSLSQSDLILIERLARSEPMPFVLDALADALRAEAWKSHACYQLGNSSQVAAHNDCLGKWAKVRALISDRPCKDARSAEVQP